MKTHPVGHRPPAGADGAQTSVVTTTTVLTGLLLVLAVAPASAAPQDAVLKAMHTELQRSMQQLKLPGQPSPYWMAYRVYDVDSDTLTARDGALTEDDTSRTRTGTVEVRVGSFQQDGSSMEHGSGFPLALDDNYDAIRHQFWFLTDQAYKVALASYSHKMIGEKQKAHPRELPDFTAAPAVVRIDELPHGRTWHADTWRPLLRRLSARFLHYPGLTATSVRLQHSVRITWLVTSEGTLVRTPIECTELSLSASLRKADGTGLRDEVPVECHLPSELPSAAELEKRVDLLAGRLTRMSQSPTEKRYLGPVLFTDSAAPQLLGDLLGSRLSGEAAANDESELGDRLQHRLLPTDVRVLDDPTVSTWQGLPLLGSYQVDAQGVPGRPVVLVENGRLKALLVGRRPGPEFRQSNGHARGSGQVGYSNLVFESKSGVSLGQLKARLREECRKQGLPYGLMVVNLEDADSYGARAMLGQMAAMMLGLHAPGVVYRVDAATGKESLVRTGPMDDVNLRTLRDIVAMGQDMHASSTLSINDGDSTSVVAPSFLVEEMEFKPYSKPTAYPPLLDKP